MFEQLLAAAAQGPDLIQMMGWMAIFMGIMWVMFIRPQSRRDKERKAMIADLKKGQRVMFSGGMMGTISHKKEDDGIYIVKIADGVKVEVHEQAIMDVIEKGTSVEDTAKNLNK